jgi:hypothetical protein
MSFRHAGQEEDSMSCTLSCTRGARRNRFSTRRLERSDPNRSQPAVPLLLTLAAASLLALLAPLDASAGQSGPASPESQTASVCRIERTASPIRVDGKPDEAAWAGALKVEVSYEVMPGENIPAPVRTECRLAYDDDNLYALFLCTDPRPQEIRARLADRDGGWGDDRVGIMLDTFNDERRAFEFFVNPLGTQADIFRNDVGSDESEDETWDTIWSSAGQITAEGYVVEIAIPFASLRFPRTNEEQTWGFTLFRDYWRGNRYQLSSTSYDRNRNCMVCQYAKLTGLQGIAPGRNLELDPTFTARQHGVYTPANRWGIGPKRADLGLSARWAVTPNLSFNAALNPDFSQVEADARQLDVNVRYALQYEERRPFFLEGADFFSTPIPAVYTRSVADPIWGAKLTGKVGANAVGVFATRDETNNIDVPADGGAPQSYSYHDQVTGAVLRYRRDVGSSSTLGALATVRESGRYHNRVFGADGLVRFAGTEGFQFQVLESTTRYRPDSAETRDLPAGEISDYAANLAYRHDSRNWAWSVAYQDFAPDFRADAGFIERVDVRGPATDFSRTWWGRPGAAITRVNVGLETTYAENHDGTPTDRYAAAYANIGGPRELYLQPRFEHNRERFAGTDYTTSFGLLRFGARPSGPFNFWGVVGYGEGVDYDNQSLARRHWGGPGFSYNYGRHVEFYIDHTYEYMSRRGERIYNVNLIQSRLVYQFTSRAFARCVIQLEDIDYNPHAYRPELQRDVPSGSTTLLLQVLGSYKVNAQTVVYIGYSDGERGRHPLTVRSVDRTFFAKLGYAWLV